MIYIEKYLMFKLINDVTCPSEVVPVPKTFQTAFVMLFHKVTNDYPNHKLCFKESLIEIE